MEEASVTKIWMLLQIVDLARDYPKLKNILNNAMGELQKINDGESQTPDEAPRAIPAEASEGNGRRA